MTGNKIAVLIAVEIGIIIYMLYKAGIAAQNAAAQVQSQVSSSPLAGFLGLT